MPTAFHHGFYLVHILPSLTATTGRLEQNFLCNVYLHHAKVRKNGEELMRIVIQRVSHASVMVEGTISGAIEAGLLVLLGIEDADTDEDINWLSNKIVNLRVFNDENGVMNLCLKEINGNLLLVSQFTLHASTRKGNRPSYSKASKADIAIPMYEKMIQQLERDLGKKIQTGIFGADMKLSLLNDGPVTIVMDSTNRE